MTKDTNNDEDAYVQYLLCQQYPEYASNLEAINLFLEQYQKMKNKYTEQPPPK